MPSMLPSTAGPSGVRPGIRGARNVSASSSSARARLLPRQKCGPAPNVSSRPSRGAVMSKSSPPGCWRLPRSEQTATIVPVGNSTPRYSTGSTHIRAVTGVIGANRLPLLRVRREHPQRVPKLGLRGVDAARDDVQHEVDALGVRQLVARLLGAEQLGQQVIAGLSGPLSQ